MKKFNESELVNWMKLTRVKKLGPQKIRTLFSYYDNIDGIVSASNDELKRTRLFNDEMINEWERLKNASGENFHKVIKECTKSNIKILTLLDEEYPQNLKRIPYPPLTLFLMGDLSLLNSQKIAIVGSRKSEEGAIEWTFNNSKLLAENGITIVSGGAIGVDSAAHKGALSVPDGKTICVLGSGFFRMYPEENIDMFKEIARRGLLISEHLPNFPGSRISFIQRNRITSGLSNGLIMVASGLSGGSMIQTKMAFEQRVPIFCPRIVLNLQPNEGLKQVIQEWNGIEIDTCKDVIKYLNQNDKSFVTSQFTLDRFG